MKILVKNKHIQGTCLYNFVFYITLVWRHIYMHVPTTMTVISSPFTSPIYRRVLLLHSIYLYYIIFDPDASNLYFQLQVKRSYERRPPPCPRRTIIEHTNSTEREKKLSRRTVTINNATSSLLL